MIPLDSGGPYAYLLPRLLRQLDQPFPSCALPSLPPNRHSRFPYAFEDTPLSERYHGTCMWV